MTRQPGRERVREDYGKLWPQEPQRHWCKHALHASSFYFFRQGPSTRHMQKLIEEICIHLDKGRLAPDVGLCPETAQECNKNASDNAAPLKGPGGGPFAMKATPTMSTQRASSARLNVMIVGVGPASAVCFAPRVFYIRFQSFFNFMICPLCVLHTFSNHFSTL